MSDRPIIFSAAMVRALLDGRKTQTRRLATSPLRRCEVGDRLYVREAWKPHSVYSGWKPRDVPNSHIFYLADDQYAPSNTPWVPSIHMPRWASRLTLIVEAVRIKALQMISYDDTIAEGAECPTCAAMKLSACAGKGCFASVTAYRDLWNSLHPKAVECWAANPAVVALTFRVERGNIDRVGA